MSRAVVYVAGPFTAKTRYERDGNIARAAEVALRVWKMGAVALCPHLNSGRFFGQVEERVVTEGYLDLVDRCDALVLVSGWQASVGTVREIQRARDAAKPVFEKVGDLRIWLKDGRS